MAQQVTAILGCTEQSPDSVIDRGRQVKARLTSNARYLTPNPDLPTLTTALDAAVDARKKWDKGNGSVSDHVKYKNAIKILFDIVEQLCSYVNNTTPHDEVALATSGFPSSNAKHKLPLMGPPREVYHFLARNIGLEKVKIKCKKPANASKYQKIIYKYYRSLNPDFTSAILIAVKTRSSHIDVPAVTVATTFYYWVTATTPAGESEPSDILKATVVPLSM